MDAQAHVRSFDPPLLGPVQVIGQKSDGQWQCIHPMHMRRSLLTLGYAELELFESWTDYEDKDSLYYELHVGKTVPSLAVPLARDTWQLRP